MRVFEEEKGYLGKMRGTFTENDSKGEMIDYELLKRLCVSDPENILVVSSFIRAYERLIRRDEEKRKDENDHLIYLKVKYLHDNKNWSYLNRIGKIYLAKSNITLAFMCFVESLRLNPNQQSIFEIIRQLSEGGAEKLPVKLAETNCKASIIMRTRGRSLQIKESIQSVLNQTLNDFELLIINDGGADDIENIVSSFKSPKIRYFKLEEKRGAVVALNEGILRARGEYIGYLDDDDVYYPKHLETLTNYIEKNNHYGAVYSNAWWCYGEQKDCGFIESSRKLNDARPKKFRKHMLLEKNYISTLNILHKKTCFNEIGLFNEDLMQLEDWDMWMKVAKKFSLYQINEITGEYRWHGNNLSDKKLLEMMFTGNIMGYYYKLNCGKIALMKGYMQIGDKRKATTIYQDELESYDSMTKNSLLASELFNIGKDLGQRKLGVHVTRDFFRFGVKNHGRRKCLGEIIKKGMGYRIFWIMDLLFLQITQNIREYIISILRMARNRPKYPIGRERNKV